VQALGAIDAILDADHIGALPRIHLPQAPVYTSEATPGVDAPSGKCG